MTGNAPVPLPNGTRVHHQGEQYMRAKFHGTATITGHLWTGGGLLYQVQRDKPPYPGAPRTDTWPMEITRTLI